MIEVVYLLLEIVTIVVCLFWLYGKKLKIDIYSIVLAVCHVALMLYISSKGLEYIYTTFIYALIVVFCILEFGFQLRKVIVNMCLLVPIVGAIQLIISFIMNPFYEIIYNKDIYFLITNLLSFLIMLLLYKYLQISMIIRYLKNENIVVQLIEAVLFLGIVIFLLHSKYAREFEGVNYIIFFIMVVITFLLAGAWEKNRTKVREKEKELHAYEIYTETYRELLDMIRMRQHEFDNHLQTIISLQYSYLQYNDLVEAQQKYIGDIKKSNKYNKLCRKGNPIFIGFLYGKLSVLEQKNIFVKCRIDINNLDTDMPVYRFIEIVSNLLNNACEALQGPIDVEEPVWLIVNETTGEIYTEVLNRSEPIGMDYLSSCFQKGKSSKGVGRGLGLYNIRLICEEYKAVISCENKLIEQKNWISFTIRIPKTHQK